MPKYEFVAVDFDGTLCTNAFPEIGEPNPVVIGYVRKLAAEGSKIILYRRRVTMCFAFISRRTTVTGS